MFESMLTFWDVVAGTVVGSTLVLGALWGARRNSSDRWMLWTCGSIAALIVAWRVAIGAGYIEPGSHEKAERAIYAEELRAKYGITPVNH